MTTIHTWVNVPTDSDFSIYNLPFGIFSTTTRTPRVGVAIGDQIVDLQEVAKQGLLENWAPDQSVFSEKSLNRFIALGKTATSAIRLKLQDLLTDDRSPLKQTPSVFVPQSEATMHLPVEVGDYTDFYSSIEHATNVGKMFRDPANALLPNWKHLPVGYHGRASSIVVSGTPIQRPSGQVLPKGADQPVFQPSARLDFELEMAFIIGKESKLGQPISTTAAADYIFGLALFNDWSARDIQQWEYVPLGPFLGKNFGSSMSPWVVTLEALEPFKINGPEQEPAVLPYLQFEGPWNFDVALEVGIQPSNSTETIVSKSNYKFMYWNMLQQLAHHTINGCNVRIGDVMASGTISGPEEGSFGSMLEIAWMGTKPIQMADGSTRTFLQDGDRVIMRGFAQNTEIRVGFGTVEGTIIGK
jgi:fumarylacetoacetase